MNPKNKKIDAWIIENTNKYLCGCGCGKFIIIHRRYYNLGIPLYGSGHQLAAAARKKRMHLNL